MDSRDDRDNNLVVAGAVFALLDHVKSHLTSIEIVMDAEGNVTNQIDIRLPFMGSPYRITVERVVDV